MTHTFLIELFRIVQSDGLGIYPKCVRRTGELPKQAEKPVLPEPVAREVEKPDLPKIVLPPLEGISKFDDIVEDEEELAKIEEGLGDLLDDGAALDIGIEGEAETVAGDEQELSIFGQEEGEEEPLEHLEDYDDIENLEIKYSRYDSGQDDN